MSITKRFFALAFLVAVSLTVLPVTGCSCSRNDNLGIALVAWTCVHSTNPVASCEAEYNEEEARFDFTIYNGFPGYHCQVVLELENTGEDAVEITSIHVEALDAPHGEVSVNLDGPSTPALVVPGDTLEVTFTIRVHDGAAQNSQYGIRGSIEAHTAAEEG